MKAVQYGLMLLLGMVTVALFIGGSPKPGPEAKAKMIERGKHIVSTSACHDCHTPKIFTKDGPILDTTRLLSGHPAGDSTGDAPQGVFGPGKWGAITNNHFTKWVGPWGTSFTRNLTPDTLTGLGSWTEDMFIKAIRNGKDMGEGRPILPPMPWPEYRHFTDDELKSIFAYLKSLPPVSNAVPDPISPTGQAIPTGVKSK